jgi:PAS domain S-box-containing protein
LDFYQSSDSNFKREAAFPVKSEWKKPQYNTLQEADERYRQIVQGLPAAFYTCNAEGYITFFNKAAAELWGREPVLGKDLWCGSWRIYNTDGTPMSLDSCPMGIALKEGRPVLGQEIIIERPDGVRLNVLPHPQPIFDDKGNVVEAINMLVDITNSKKAEQALRESDEQFRQLADFVPQMVWTARPDGFLDYYNKQWFEYTGFDVGYGDDSFLPILHPDDAQACMQAWYDSVSTGEPYRIEYRFRDKSNPGSYRWFLGKASPIRDKENRIVKWFGTCTDIHDTRMIAEDLEKRVAERTRELKDSNAALKRSNAELEQFAYIASHDLQEPLRKIKTYTGRLLEKNNGLLDEVSKSYFDKIISSTERMTGLIKDVLDYSRISNLDEKFVKTDLNRVMRDVTSDFDLLITEKNAAIECRSLPEIEAIPLQMHQLFGNLMSNALKFTIKGISPRINISSRNLTLEESAHMPDPGLAYCEIVFSDNGIGFQQEYSEQIFVIFQRLNERHKFSGTGIGLALCRKIASMHKGEIFAVSSENEGASFHVILPIKHE